MGKFINPKKIKGQDKLNRIKDLMGKMNTLTESKSFSELELIKKGPNGIVYGVIRENHDYFIKTTEKTSGTFLSEDFNYVGGIQNKYDERYGSYAEAIKHLNMKFDMLNESFGIKKGNSIFESDGVPTANASGGIKSGGLGFVMENPENDHEGQSCWEAHEKNQQSHEEWKDEQNEEEAPETKVDYEGEEETLIADQKKVIKVDAPAAPAPVEAPVEDEVVVDEFGGEEGGEDEFGEEEEVEEFAEEGEGDEYTKKIQKLTGKVAQLMRDMDEPDPELEKYVINSIVSAVDFEEMDDEDVEDIIAKIEGEDEEDDEFGAEVEELGGEEDEGVGDEFGEEDLAESEEKEGEEKEKEGDEEEDKGDENVDYEDKKERKKHYKGDVEDIEDKIDKLKKDLKRAKKEEKNESRTFSKKQLMESFLKKNTNLALKKVLKENRTICEECMGAGCGSCSDVTVSDIRRVRPSFGEDPMEENLTEQIEEFDTFDDWRGSSYYNSPESDPWDISRGGYDDTNKRYFDRHIEKYGPFRIKPWEDSYAGTFGPDDNDLPWIDSKNRHLDEIYSDTDMEAGDDVGIVEEDLSIMDALATGQDYLQATGDLDRDGDDIPNRLDLDNNADGRLDHGMDNDYIEIDIDSIMGNAPVKEPDIKPPTTTPGTKPRKPRWREITRPGVDPRPKALKERKKSSIKRRGMYK